MLKNTKASSGKGCGYPERIALGADHGGFALKERVRKTLEEKGYRCTDFGTATPDSCDYPDIGYRVAKEVACGTFERGILICTTGIGMSIVANKVPGIRAALCDNPENARCAREHNDANVLVLPGKFMEPALAEEVAEVWLMTGFSNAERHVRRVNKIREIERAYCKDREKT